MKSLHFWALALLTFAAWNEPHAHANWDLQYSLLGRSYTPGAMAQVNLGYPVLLWGQDPRPELPAAGPRADGPTQWKFGYVRPLATFQSAVIMNRANLELEFFPVSIFGVAAGYGIHQRPHFSQQFNCDTEASCRGVLGRSMLRGNLALGAAGVFAVGMFRQEWVHSISAESATRPFSDEGMGILGQPSGDQFRTVQVALGYRIDPLWNAGVQVIHCSASKFENFSATSLLFLNHFRGSTSYVLGAGTYRSSFVETGFTLAAFITVNVKRPLGLM